jgi:hypothetical protein
MAANGERPRCSDPVTREMWTSDDQHDRDIAVKWCAGCVVIVECGDAADELGEKWHVFGGSGLYEEAEEVSSSVTGWDH